VVVVMMGDENDANVADVYTSFHKPAGDAITGIYDIMRPVDSQQIRRLCPPRAWDGTRRGSKCDEAGACLRGRRIPLRPAFIAQHEHPNSHQRHGNY